MSNTEEINQIKEPIAIIKKISEYQSSEINWLSEGRIAMGKLTLIAGDPGLGKSFMALELCARVSRGELGAQGNGTLPRAVIMSAEDDVSDTIRPRLERMCADVDRIHFIESISLPNDKPGRSNMPQLDRDVHTIARAIRAIGEVSLVVIDPISAYMGKADSHNNAEVRAVLGELALLAQFTGAAVVCVTHLNKDSGGKSAVYRAMGSLAFTAAARTVHLVTKHPGKGEMDRFKRIVSMVKNNLGIQKPPRVYVIDDGMLTWLDETVAMTSDELASGEQASMIKDRPYEQAVMFLERALEGGASKANAVKALAEQYDIKSRTLERAKKNMNIKSVKVAGEWYWRINNQSEDVLFREALEQAPDEPGHGVTYGDQYI